jgi:triacylglycerol lipase
MLLKIEVFFLIPFFSIGCISTPLVAQIVSEKYVLLLHGLGRSRFSMYFLGAYLQNQGFKVLNIGYPSTKYPIEQLVKNVAEQIKKSRIESANKIHFVTHSMGGIITRLYLKENQPENLGRVVMLSPPNQGSELTDSLKNNLLYQWVMGPAGQQLGTEPSSMPNQLGTVNFELGVITGNTSLNPVYSYLIPGNNDGKVSVKRAQVAGMKDFFVVSHSHSFIMNSRFVREQIVYFLDNGKFRRLPKETE